MDPTNDAEDVLGDCTRTRDLIMHLRDCFVISTKNTWCLISICLRFFLFKFIIGGSGSTLLFTILFEFRSCSDIKFSCVAVTHVCHRPEIGLFDEMCTSRRTWIFPQYLQNKNCDVFIGHFFTSITSSDKFGTFPSLCVLQCVSSSQIAIHVRWAKINSIIRNIWYVSLCTSATLWSHGHGIVNAEVQILNEITPIIFQTQKLDRGQSLRPVRFSRSADHRVVLHGIRRTFTSVAIVLRHHHGQSFLSNDKFLVHLSHRNIRWTWFWLTKSRRSAGSFSDVPL